MGVVRHSLLSYRPKPETALYPFSFPVALTMRNSSTPFRNASRTTDRESRDGSAVTTIKNAFHKTPFFNLKLNT